MWNNSCEPHKIRAHGSSCKGESQGFSICKFILRTFDYISGFPQVNAAVQARLLVVDNLLWRVSYRQLRFPLGGDCSSVNHTLENLQDCSVKFHGHMCSLWKTIQHRGFAGIVSPTAASLKEKGQR